MAVTRGARLFGNDGGIAAQDAIEQRGLADIGSANERDNRDV